MKNSALIVLAACALSACSGNDNGSSHSSSSSSSGAGGSSGSSSGTSSSSSGTSSSGASSSGSSSSGSGSSSSGAAAQGIYCGSFTATGASGGSSSGSSSGSGSSGASSSGSSSSGSGSSSSSAAPSGFCSGSSSAALFFGLVQADGNAVLFTKAASSFVLYSPSAFTGLSFTSVPVTAFGLNDSTVGGAPGGTDKGTLSGNVTLASGLIGNGTALAGSIADAAGNTVSFNGKSNAADWNSASSLSTVTGSYTGSFSVGGVTYAPSLTIDSTGKITGTDSTGCTYAGAVTTPDTSHNDYAVTLTSTCLSKLGTFSGIGAFFPSSLLSNPNGLLAPAALKAGLTNGKDTGIFLDLAQ